MAPTPGGVAAVAGGRIARELWHTTSSLVGRSLGRSSDMESHSVRFSDDQVDIQKALALTTASISLFCGIVTIGWFLRMRQMFRHRLIMMLIISDMIKALWYFIYPIVLYTRRREYHDPRLCQATGFMLAMGIEGADFAVLMIAIHAALGIFSNKNSMGESGLFDYRYYVYAGWVLIPITMASLAFINPTGGYVSQGTFCYLPVRPFWYRLALSWIPRYLILIAIATIAISIYFYVRLKFKNFTANTQSYEGSSGNDRSQKNRDSKQMNFDGTMSGSSVPTLAEHHTPGMSRKTFVESADAASAELKVDGMPSWENYTFGGPTPISRMPDHEIIKEDLHTRYQSARKSAGSSSSTGFTDDTAAIISALKEFEPFSPTSPNAGAANKDGGASLELVDSKNQPLATSRLRQRHKAIQRQLRYVFVYPIVYFVLWIIPFIQHCRNYSTTYSLHPSFPLSCITTSILALQCAIDSIVFCNREKPWRHIDSRAPISSSGNNDDQEIQGSSASHPTFLSSVTPSLVFIRSLRSSSSSKTNRNNRDSSRNLSTASDGLSSRPEYRPPTDSQQHRSGGGVLAGAFQHSSLTGGGGHGKSKADRVAEARQAQKRREVEASEAARGAKALQMARKMSLARRKGQGRSWWEVEGRRRKDSVLLGTDDGDACALSAGPGVQRSRSKTDREGSVAQDSIEDEDATAEPLGSSGAPSRTNSAKRTRSNSGSITIGEKIGRLRSNSAKSERAAAARESLDGDRDGVGPDAMPRDEETGNIARREMSVVMEEDEESIKSPRHSRNPSRALGVGSPLSAIGEGAAGGALKEKVGEMGEVEEAKEEAGVEEVTNNKSATERLGKKSGE